MIWTTQSKNCRKTGDFSCQWQSVGWYCPDLSLNLCPQPLQSFSTSTMNPSKVRQQGSNNNWVRAASWEVLSHPSLQWTTTLVPCCILLTIERAPLRIRHRQSSHPDSPSTYRYSLCGLLARSLLQLSLTAWILGIFRNYTQQAQFWACSNPFPDNLFPRAAQNPRASYTLQAGCTGAALPSVSECAALPISLIIFQSYSHRAEKRPLLT